MLQIGIHYTDVLEYLLGPIKAVSGSLAQLVLPGDNPDVASLILEHENGALSTLNASYASASEYYLMNVYGKDASAYYDCTRACASSSAATTSARSRSLRQERRVRRRARGVRRRGARRGEAGDGRRGGTALARGASAPGSCRRAKAGGWRSRRS